MVMLFAASWCIAWLSGAAGLLLRLPRLATLLLLAIAAWAFTVVGVIILVHEHALLLRATVLIATLRGI